jgi:superfamily I DNA/RNA helicase
MARVVPNGWRQLSGTLSNVSELDTLEILERELDDGYVVYHGVHWTKLEKHNYSIYGEIDFVIVSPSGKLLLIEQKSGTLIESELGLEKIYGAVVKNIPFQMGRNAQGLLHRLKDSVKGNKVFVDTILYCPDYKVKTTGTAGLDPQRIVDSSRKSRLTDIIREIVPPSDVDHHLQEVLHVFLSDLLEIVTDVSATVGQVGKAYTRISGGLAEWVQKLEFSPFKLLVLGTAGSGKTQLALQVYRDSIRQRRRPLYVCFNRPLADHIAGLLPPGGTVSGYHQLADQISRLLGIPINHQEQGAFAALERILDNYQPMVSELFDDLIVDEGQDFKPEWAANLMRFLNDDARVFWLADPMQDLYSRGIQFSDEWVTIRSDSNYRTPRKILEAINQILKLTPPLRSCSPIEGQDVEVFQYSDNSEIVPKTIQALDHCVSLGFDPAHISLLTFRGRESSRLTPYTELGSHRLRSALLGKYSESGNPEFSDGDITIESVHRFKGRSAPCVVLTEIDFEQFDDNVRKRIFVGATRATIKLVLVISERSLQALVELGDITE